MNWSASKAAMRIDHLTLILGAVLHVGHEVSSTSPLLAQRRVATAHHHLCVKTHVLQYLSAIATANAARELAVAIDDDAVRLLACILQ